MSIAKVYFYFRSLLRNVKLGHGLFKVLQDEWNKTVSYEFVIPTQLAIFKCTCFLILTALCLPMSASKLDLNLVNRLKL